MRAPFCKLLRGRTAAAALLLCSGLSAPLETHAAEVHLQLPPHRLQADQLAVIVNDADPLSVKIGDYYQRERQLPARNLLHVRFEPGDSAMSADTFAALREAIYAGTPAQVQAYAVTWAAPYRVECMSFTSALTFGFDRGWCSSRTCAPTRRSPYFGYSGARPWDDLGVRPSMAIAATDFDHARALIDRGIAADGSSPQGTAYLVSTADKARNVRARGYAAAAAALQQRVNTQVVETPALRNRDDVLFYFTGAKQVEHLDSLQFRPGAIADHLTSAGGRLTDSRQMSALRWLQAGATGSYGTVVEPCNRLGKFPDPLRVMASYTSGRTLLEAYWQSVQQPGEGIFIGEPLAAPFDREARIEAQGEQLQLYTDSLLPGNYRLDYAGFPVGPWQTLGLLRVSDLQGEFTLPGAGDGYYRLIGIPAAD